MANGCCEFMQEEDGLHIHVQIMGTVVAEIYETGDK